MLQSHKDALAMESDNKYVWWDEGLLQEQISRISIEIGVLRKAKERVLREKNDLEKEREKTAREAGAAI
jgi:heme exporter protein D